jgi:hypothetical protein
MNREKRNAYRILVEKPKGKRPLGRTSHRWVDNIKMHLREIGWGGMDCTDLIQDRDQWRALANTVTCGLKAGTCAFAGWSFARHFLMVTQNISLLWVLMEPLETYPW